MAVARNPRIGEVEPQMKITISSPDGLGDFILRIPLLRGLLAGGHELQMFMRRPALDLAATVFPEAQFFEIGADPYHPETRRKKNPFRVEHRAVRKFRPDLYVAPLFALSFFDEVWFEDDYWRVPVTGFSTRDAFWPSCTIADPAGLSENFRIRVEVPVALPELEKNRLLGSAILGCDLPTVSPSLASTEESLAAAREILRLHGLTEGEYWVACVGSRPGLAMKEWGEDNWREFFSSVLPAGGRPVVFFGNQKEWASIERIRSGGFVSVNLADRPPPVPVSLALVAMSCGYLGRDSGVMHMASAAGRPVLAAFSGGHWGRFFPSSGPAIVVTQSMSCRMCDHACPHGRPFCITSITPDAMLAGWRRLSSAKNVELIEQVPPEGIDTVSPDEVRTFAMRRSAETRERESLARSRSWWRRMKPFLISLTRSILQPQN